LFLLMDQQVFLCLVSVWISIG